MAKQNLTKVAKLYNEQLKCKHYRQIIYQSIENYLRLSNQIFRRETDFKNWEKLHKL